MSLFKQLWLNVVVMTVVVFSGSFLLSILAVKNFLTQQIYLKNVDNATSLALTLSQLPAKDPVLVELLIASQFDMGHYEEITLTDPNHRIIVQRLFTQEDIEAPHWFVRLFPLHTEPGIAQVQDGWKQYGTLRVISHSRFARNELWKDTLNLMIWFLLAGAVTGTLGTLILQRIAKSLNRMTGHALAISERRFITVEEPETPEHTRMMIVTDYNRNQYRLFFLTEESEESLFDFPDEG